MELRHIELNHLKVSPLNMRHGRKSPDISDILPSVREIGILQPLLVRKAKNGKTHEIIAGRRRFHAAKAVEKEGIKIGPIPCAIMEKGDDARAIEASLLENLARLDADPMSQYETFAALAKKGRDAAEIAALFGITEASVKRRLALGNLAPGIRQLYKDEKIDAETARLLTMATSSQQEEWLELVSDPDSYAPQGRRLKSWLFGGERLALSVALFPIEDYKGRIVTDLFGEDEYFADAEEFWKLQNTAVAAKRDAYLADGWGDVIVFAPGEGPGRWELGHADKEDGGKVFLYVGHNGAMEICEGVLTEKEMRRLQRKLRANKGGIDDGSGATASMRPELTKAAQNYVELHRHGAVRHALLGEPGVALRLMVAHAIGGSALWRVEAEPGRAHTEAIDASIKTSVAETLFEGARKSAAKLLGRPENNAPLARGRFDEFETATVFARLLTLSDAQVMEVLATVMAETLSAGSLLVEALGNHLSVDMNRYWKPDEVFFQVLRDKQAINALLGEVAGKGIADRNLTATAKIQKGLIQEALTAKGTGKAPQKGKADWCPRYFRFPFAAYTKRDNFAIADGWKRISKLFNSPD